MIHILNHSLKHSRTIAIIKSVKLHKVLKMAKRKIIFQNSELEFLSRLANKNQRWLECNNNRRRTRIELMTAGENLTSASIELLAYVVSENNFEWCYGSEDRSSIYLLYASCKQANELVREFLLLVEHLMADTERQLA